jgi:hypothetical protein
LVSCGGEPLVQRSRPLLGQGPVQLVALRRQRLFHLLALLSERPVQLLVLLGKGLVQLPALLPGGFLSISVGCAVTEVLRGQGAD